VAKAAIVLSLFGPSRYCGTAIAVAFKRRLKNIRNKNGFSRICSLKLTALLKKRRGFFPIEIPEILIK